MSLIKRFSIGIFALLFAFSFTLVPGNALADAVTGDTVVTLGKDLTPDQRNAILTELGINASNTTLIEVTNEEEHQYLGSYMSKAIIGTKALSSAKIVIQDNGQGISVKTNKITHITDSMYANAAITAGVKDADIVVTAPFNVSGTAGLTGIIKAFETATGQKINEEQKQVANEELVRTFDLSKEFGDSEDAGNQAAQFMTALKKEIAEEKPETPEEYRDIIINISNEFNVNLSQQTINQLVEFGTNFASLGIDWDQFSDQLSKLRGDINEILNANIAEGFFGTIFGWLGDFFSAIGKFFTSWGSSD